MNISIFFNYFKNFFSNILAKFFACSPFYLKKQESLIFRFEAQPEGNEELFNPGCGWYHVYTFQAQPEQGKTVDQETWLDESSKQERLALVLINLGDFQSTPLSISALGHISRIMKFFCEQEKRIILRCTYDLEGLGQEHEPASIELVKTHMEQVGKAIEPYLKDILVMQGIFVGSWGEMHHSKFVDAVSLVDLINTQYAITQEQCFLAVRTPLQWRLLENSPAISDACLEKVGLFNDGMFGSSTDLGTYGFALLGEKLEKWVRRQELEWQDEKMAHVPNGGEVVANDPLTSYEQALPDLYKMHVSYLNGIYQPEQLDFWKNEGVEEEGWQGINGYDYIGRHLGYRFSIVDVTKNENELEIVVENTGFGNLCEEGECLLGLETEGEMRWKSIDTDPRTWQSLAKTQFSIDLPFDLSQATKIYLALRRKEDEMPIRFANQGADKILFLGSLNKEKE